MADILKIDIARTPKEMLEDVVTEYEDTLKAVVIITKSSDDVYEVCTSAGTSILERVGMCDYASSVLISMMRKVYD